MTVCTWIATRAVTKPVAPAPSSSHPNKSVSPPTPDRWNARALLRARRDDWGIESTFHQRLDTTLDEDRSRVRTPNAVHALGLFRRLVVSVGHAWLEQAQKKNPGPACGRLSPHCARTMPGAP